ncbi:phage tail protein, partial [Xenorhabdus bovienii]|nr:phage tail protein [Xenorhabdus bovienii]
SYKSAWRIVETDGYINVPNYFTWDGRGYFVRAGRYAGVEQSDAMRRLQGDFVPTAEWTDSIYSYGVFTHEKTVPGAVVTSEFVSRARERFYFDNANVTPVADENRPINISQLPIIYLGV